MVKVICLFIIAVNLGFILPALIYAFREALLESKEEYDKEHYEKHGYLPKGR